MEVLVSNRLGAGVGFGVFGQRVSQLISSSRRISIATGYASRDALAFLTGVVRKNPGAFDSFNVWIGMGLYGGLTGSIRGAAEVLSQELTAQGIGDVHLVEDWPYHGKVYLFGTDSDFDAAIIGSSNLSALLDQHRNVELDIYVEEPITLCQLARFIDKVLLPSSITIATYADVAVSEQPFHPARYDYYADVGEERLDVLKGVRALEYEELVDVTRHVGTREFLHYLKTTPKSNLNVYHSKGRLQRPKGRATWIKPRPWYEIEMILSKAERESDLAPPVGEFTVVTDDGWTFALKRQGDYGKNVRSVGDLRILGKWIKGRMESAGVLRAGEVVTRDVLDAYGRDTVGFKPIEDGTGRWYLDFSVSDRHGAEQHSGI